MPQTPVQLVLRKAVLAYLEIITFWTLIPDNTAMIDSFSIQFQLDGCMKTVLVGTIYVIDVLLEYDLL